MAHLHEGIGGHPVPPDLSSGATTAVELDPARARLGGLFKQVLISELGSAWTQVTDTMGARWSGTAPVEGEVLELKSTRQVMQALKKKLPLLSIARVGRATFEDHTVHTDQMTQQWRLVWILGQAGVEEQRKLGDFLTAGAKHIRLAVRRRGHPDYDGGALQFFPTTGGLGSVAIQWVETEPASINENSEVDWLVMEMGLETVEYGNWDDEAFVNADYMTLEMGVGDSTGYIPSLINADSRYPEGDPRP